MQSNIAKALSLRFPPLAINYTWEPPVHAAEIHPLCSMLLLARAAKGETVAITKGTCGCHGALEGFGLGRSRPDPGGHPKSPTCGHLKIPHPGGVFKA